MFQKVFFRCVWDQRSEKSIPPSPHRSWRSGTACRGGCIPIQAVLPVQAACFWGERSVPVPVCPSFHPCKPFAYRTEPEAPEPAVYCSGFLGIVVCEFSFGMDWKWKSGSERRIRWRSDPSCVRPSVVRRCWLDGVEKNRRRFWRVGLELRNRRCIAGAISFSPAERPP